MSFELRAQFLGTTRLHFIAPNKSQIYGLASAAQAAFGSESAQFQLDSTVFACGILKLREVSCFPQRCKPRQKCNVIDLHLARPGKEFELGNITRWTRAHINQHQHRLVGREQSVMSMPIQAKAIKSLPGAMSSAGRFVCE